VQIASPADIEYRSLNIAPDGNSIYYSEAAGTIYQIPVLGGAAKKLPAICSKTAASDFRPTDDNSRSRAERSTAMSC
jgi:hypothetical protein